MEVLTKEVVHFDQLSPWQKTDVKGGLLIYFFQRATISHKISETNSSFRVKWRTTGKVLLLIFGTFFASINNFFILVGRMGTGYHFFKFRHFPTIS